MEKHHRLSRQAISPNRSIRHLWGSMGCRERGSQTSPLLGSCQFDHRWVVELFTVGGCEAEVNWEVATVIVAGESVRLIFFCLPREEETPVSADLLVLRTAAWPVHSTTRMRNHLGYQPESLLSQLAMQSRLIYPLWQGRLLVKSQ